MNAFTDRLLDLGMEADVACWQVAPDVVNFFRRPADREMIFRQGSGTGHGYTLRGRLTPYYGSGDGYDGVGAGPSAWRLYVVKYTLDSVFGEVPEL